MLNIFDTSKINIKLRDFSDQVIGIVTINFNEQIEVRFAAILWKESRTGLFLSMPSIKSHGYQKCVVVLDEGEYKKFADRVMKLFLEKAKEFYNKYEYETIEKAVQHNEQREEKINFDDIPL
jgi:DNA-binding cell septation regulator SpoVG